jgi:hypothetical protein
MLFLFSRIDVKLDVSKNQHEVFLGLTKTVLLCIAFEY